MDLKGQIHYARCILLGDVWVVFDLDGSGLYLTCVIQHCWCLLLSSSSRTKTCLHLGNLFYLLCRLKRFAIIEEGSSEVILKNSLEIVHLGRNTFEGEMFRCVFRFGLRFDQFSFIRYVIYLASAILKYSASCFSGDGHVEAHGNICGI